MYDNNGYMYQTPYFMYPIEYHRKYGHMYPEIDFDIDGPMVYPTMYPEIYYRIYPYVCKICDRMDNAYVPYPSEAHVEAMIDECYDTCVREMPDLEEYAGCTLPMATDAEASQIRRRRPILRDLIAIILLSELFRRRRRRFRPFPGYGF